MKYFHRKILLVGYISFQVRRTSTNSWVDVGEPFLMGTVALGGTATILPVVYSKVVLLFRN